MKLIYQSQVPLGKRECFSMSNNSSSTHSPMNPYSLNLKNKIHKFTACTDNKAINYVHYIGNIELYYYDSNRHSEVDTKLLDTEEDPSLKEYQWIVSRPSLEKTTREHEIYANLDKKHKASLQ